MNDFNVPELDLKDRQGNTDYIDFIKEEELGENSVMKGKDKFNREFVVMKVRCGDNQYFQTFFKRYSSETSIWMGCGNYGVKFMNTCGGMDSNQFYFLNTLVANGKITITPNEFKKYKLYNMPETKDSLTYQLN